MKACESRPAQRPSATWVAISWSGSGVSEMIDGSVGVAGCATSATGGRQSEQNMLRSMIGWPSLLWVVAATPGDDAGRVTLGPCLASASILPAATLLTSLAAKTALPATASAMTTQK